MDKLSCAEPNRSAQEQDINHFARLLLRIKRRYEKRSSYVVHQENNVRVIQISVCIPHIEQLRTV